MGFFIIHPALRTFFLHKPDGTGRAVFAVDVGVTAFETFVAQIYTVLHAHEAGLFFRMTGTLAHFENLSLLHPKRGCYLFTCDNLVEILFDFHFVCQAGDLINYLAILKKKQGWDSLNTVIGGS